MDKIDGKRDVLRKILLLSGMGSTFIMVAVVSFLLNYLDHRTISSTAWGVWLIFALVGVIMIITGVRLQKKHQLPLWKKAVYT